MQNVERGVSLDEIKIVISAKHGKRKASVNRFRHIAQALKVKLLPTHQNLCRYVGIRFDLRFGQIQRSPQNIIVRKNAVMRQSKMQTAYFSRERMIVTVFLFRSLGRVTRMTNKSTSIVTMFEIHLISGFSLLYNF